MLSSLQLYPDESTLDQLYGGVRYQDLPSVTIRCSFDITRFYAHDAQENQIESVNPYHLGFKESEVGTNIAAEVAATSIAQKLRSRLVFVFYYTFSYS